MDGSKRGSIQRLKGGGAAGSNGNSSESGSTEKRQAGAGSGWPWASPWKRPVGRGYRAGILGDSSGLTI